jgi:hypothetical protein
MFQQMSQATRLFVNLTMADVMAMIAFGSSLPLLINTGICKRAECHHLNYERRYIYRVVVVGDCPRIGTLLEGPVLKRNGNEILALALTVMELATTRSHGLKMICDPGEHDVLLIKLFFWYGKSHSSCCKQTI